MKKTLPLLILSLLILGSCVSKKKYTALEDEKGRLSKDYALLTMQRDSLLGIVNDLEGDIEKLNQESRQRAAMTDSELQKLNEDLNNKLAQLGEYQQIIQNMEEANRRQKEAQAQLLNNLERALTSFDSDELTVENREGKIYVSLSENLLFKSGSTKVDPKGEDALGKVAEVLSKQRDIDIVIEGHTDSIPIASANYKDNWDLSVLRATSIVRILTREGGVDPKQIIPSGRGEYLPVADNSTSDGRARNRRTEIILSPRISEILKLLDTAGQ